MCVDILSHVHMRRPICTQGKYAPHAYRSPIHVWGPVHIWNSHMHMGHFQKLQTKISMTTESGRGYSVLSE